jgi:hypothetical protein
MASHVAPDLAISGTQPSATPSDDDGSRIGLAEVSAPLIPPHNPSLGSDPQP